MGLASICHNGNVITVGKAAALAHALHGDCVGTCGSGPDYPALKVNASPSRSSSQTARLYSKTTRK